jgi:hypothetical protein
MKLGFEEAQTPYTSGSQSAVIEREDGQFVVLWSPETAEHKPDYRELGRFVTRAEAEVFVATG